MTGEGVSNCIHVLDNSNSVGIAHVLWLKKKSKRYFRGAESCKFQLRISHQPPSSEGLWERKEIDPNA